MQHPSAVSLECRTGAGWALVQAGLWAASVWALAAWLMAHAQALGWLSPLSDVAWAGVGLLAALPVGGLAWLRARAERGCRLSWDGTGWTLTLIAPAGQLDSAAGGDASASVGTPAAAWPCRPQVAWDLDGWMLLHCAGAPRRARWQSASRLGQQAHWAPFRAALYFSATRSTTGQPARHHGPAA